LDCRQIGLHGRGVIRENAFRIDADLARKRSQEATAEYAGRQPHELISFDRLEHPDLNLRSLRKLRKRDTCFDSRLLQSGSRTRHGFLAPRATSAASIARLQVIPLSACRVLAAAAELRMLARFLAVLAAVLSIGAVRGHGALAGGVRAFVRVGHVWVTSRSFCVLQNGGSFYSRGYTKSDFAPMHFRHQA